jgi:hypothetical protein
MPAIASLDDLKATQQDLRQAKDLDELKAAFKKWRRIGWKKERSALSQCASHQDGQEGLKAFVENRKPCFKGK